jgi:hypothetical protein
MLTSPFHRFAMGPSLSPGKRAERGNFYKRL